MATSESRTPANVPNLYDGLAGIVVVSILAGAFLYVQQPTFGLLLTVAFGSVHATGRINDLEYGVVVAGLWGFVIASVWSVGTLLSFGVAAILAVVGYGYWRDAW